MKRITMSEVAGKAGVSKSTVSHVINNTRFVEDDTRERVLSAIKELNYRPSLIAKSLVSRRTNTVGLLISDVANPFYHQVIMGVEDTALANNYNVFLLNASYDLERSLRYLKSIIDRQVDGAMVMSSRLSVELVAELRTHHIPAVVLDWAESEVQGVATLGLRFEIGIQQAVDHLVELGHRHFAHVSGPLDLWTAVARRDILLAALAEHGIPPAEVLVVEGNLRVEGGRSALRRIMAGPDRPTAIFTANDLTALGVVWEAREYGLNIPDDLSVVGLDDIPLAEQITPSLTTVALPSYRIGAEAMSMLIGLINLPEGADLDAERFHRHIETHLVIRQTTAAPPT